MSTLPPVTPPSVQFYGGPPRPSGNKMAVVALVLGIFTLLFSAIPFFIVFGWITAGLAVVLGLASGFPARPRRVLGLVGAGLGALGFLIALVSTVAFVAAAGSSANSTSPAAVAPAQPGPTVSAAPEPAPAVEPIAVPDVTGKTGDVAQDAISEAGLTVQWDAGNDSVILSSNWTVVGQTPEAGAQVAPDSEVTLKVVKTETLNPPSSDTDGVSDKAAYLAGVRAQTGVSAADYSDAKLLNLGEQTCEALDEGTSIDTYALTFANEDATTRRAAAVILVYSSKFLCPSHDQEVMDWAKAHSNG